jgi:hypothetical protein
VRGDQLDSVVAQLGVEAVAVVGPIANEFFRKLAYEPRGKGVVDELRFMTLSTRSPDGDRKAMAVCHCHDLGRFAAASDPNIKTPLFAPA